MGRFGFALPLVVACSDPAAMPDAGVDAEPDATTAALSIAPASFNYGELDLGTSDTPLRTFTVTNVTAAPVDLASVAMGGQHAEDFTINSDTCGPSLEAMASCAVSIKFSPTASNQREALLEVMGPTLVTAYLQGTALVQSQRLYITPGARDFGDVGVGETSAQLTFDVINEAAAAPLTATVEPNGTAFSIVSSDCAATTVPLHGTCSVTVQWAPGYSGAHGATLQLTGPGVGTWGAGLIGTSSRPLSITPSTGTMGSMLVGQIQPTELRTFTITNTSTTDTTASLTPSFTGAAAASYVVESTTCTALAPLQSCDVVVRLAAANATRGSKLAQLVVADGTSTVAVRANLMGSVYTVLITGDETFPNTTSGQQSAIQTFTVVNASDQPTGAITTTVGAQFSIASNTCAAGIADHSSCEVGVRFTPSSAGAQSADLQLTATGAGGTDSVTLSGTGL